MRLPSGDQSGPRSSAVFRVNLRTSDPSAPMTYSSPLTSVAVAVPASAVVRDGDRDAVWVQDGRVARKRIVTVGTQGEDAVEVRDGVEEGDRVVVRGADQVQEGQELP